MGWRSGMSMSERSFDKRRIEKVTLKETFNGMLSHESDFEVPSAQLYACCKFDEYG